MNLKASEKNLVRSLESDNFVAILGIAAEMARRINENIAKVHLEPLCEALTTASSREATTIRAEPSKA